MTADNLQHHLTDVIVDKKLKVLFWKSSEALTSQQNLESKETKEVWIRGQKVMRWVCWLMWDSSWFSLKGKHMQFNFPEFFYVDNLAQFLLKILNAK